ncbi:PAS domain S-box protein [Candidatus Dojkabacteria bacterium]|uniref:histidine kinase n=1 Tax=Candidatus Dojkabacteria bacterium TaxID=2099670 RepID=A0A955RLK1_9BACT|nr:PAS domain S-box protein [Candidatus Dojkabacteria bacterium]
MKKLRTLLPLASTSNVFQLAVKSAFNHIIITDDEGTIVFANSAAEKITGYSHEELIGSKPSLWGSQMPKEFYKKLWDTIKVKKQHFVGEFNNRRKNGELYVAKAIISPILDARNTLVGFIGTEDDITIEKEAEKMKTEFVSITAHQLKTPLTTVKWNLDILKDLMKDPSKEILQQIEHINKANEDLISLIDVLLNISRLEMGRVSVTPESVSINEALNNVVNIVQILCQKYKVAIQVEDFEDFTVNLDSRLFNQVILNLLTNAIKYSQENSVVNVSIRNNDDFFEIHVVDSGYGIPQKDQSKIFSKHFRSANVIDKEIEGTGLGLYCTQLIVKLFKGKIEFTSTEGQGSNFWVSIPKSGMVKQEGELSLSTERVL